MTRYPYDGAASYTLAANHEAEFYSNSSIGVNPFSVQNGVLSISAAPAAQGSNPYGLPYTSGVITTDTSFSQTYGYFEMRATLPLGQGLWPAFWMLPASNVYTSELDVMEAVNNNTNTVFSTVHGTTQGVFGANSQAVTVPNVANGFHTYGVDWEPQTTTFYVDGVQTASAPTPDSMNTPMFMLLDLAVGGDGSWPGAPDGSTQFPAALKVDDVRAYATAGTQFVGGRAAIPANAAPPTPAPTPTPAPSGPVTIGSGPDVLALQVSEDAWQGDAQYTVSVDGTQIGGVQSAGAAHSSGSAATLNVQGTFGPGSHHAAINFLNDAYGGSAGTDRNLYVTGAAIDGAAVPNANLALMSAGTQGFDFAGAAVVTVPPVSSGPDSLVLGVSEDAWNGDAQFTVSVDGRQAGGTYTATASHAAGAQRSVQVSGQWGSGQHTIGVTFINDAYGGSAGTDRNLYVDSVSYNGGAAGPVPSTFWSDGTMNFVTATPAPQASAAPSLQVQLAEDAYHGDAQFTLALDGKQVGAQQSVTASNDAGAAQTVTVPGPLPTGWHDLSVSFLNDLYAGSPSSDRNLYVKAIDINGTAVAGGSASLYSDGTQHFAVYIPPS